VTIFAGMNNGSFAAGVDYAVASGPRQMAIADFDGDGRPDIAVTDGDDGDLSLILGGSGKMLVTTYTVGADPWGITASDLNGDGEPDIIFGHQSDNTYAVIPGTLSCTP
jgi:hypothetical protein